MAKTTIPERVFMVATPPYKRALLKISGDAFTSDGNDIFDIGKIDYLCGEIQEAVATGCELALVLGGGNIMRGAQFAHHGSGRINADNAGMMATLVNGFILKQALETADVAVKLYSAFEVAGLVEVFDVNKGVQDIKSGKTILLAGGTGNPLFTTDTAAALRALQLEAQIVLKATRVAGVYNADPEEDDTACFFEQLDYEEILARKLGIMDLCAVSLCMEHDVPVCVFDYQVKGNLKRVLSGENTGTFIGAKIK